MFAIWNKYPTNASTDYEARSVLDNVTFQVRQSVLYTTFIYSIYVRNMLRIDSLKWKTNIMTNI